MPYLGNTPTTQSFISGTDYFNGTGAQTAFTLSRTPGSVNDIQAVVNNVVQQPNDAYTLSGNTITFTSAPSTGTNNVYVRYLSTTTQVITPSQNTVSWSTLDSNVQGDLGINNKNRIINGAMVIDQRNAGASVTPTNSQYLVDRFFASLTQTSKFTAQQNAGSVTPPAGFTNYLGVTSSSSYAVLAGDLFVIGQAIEGFNTADLDFGKATAKTVTLSFWVRSSLTGTFGGSLINNASNRSYPFSYTINAANTWEQKSITIAGDTTGTWVGATNGVGLYVYFNLGSGSTYSGTAGAWAGSLLTAPTGATSVVGTNGATFYITGVQLEVGTQATTFTPAGSSYGAELALCQRYYYKTYSASVVPGTSTQLGAMSLEVLADGTLTRLKLFSGRLPVSMRTQPTVTAYSETGTADRISVYNNNISTLTVSSIVGRGENSFGFYLNTTSNASASASYMAQFVASAEL
jgi:hypothetical protein